MVSYSKLYESRGAASGGAAPNSAALAEAPGSRVPVVDMSGFEHPLWLNAATSVGLAAVTLDQIGPGTRPEHVPWSVIEAMGWDPVIYAGEQAATCTVQTPSLYYVRHDDPAIVAETDEWLRPLLPRLLPMIARAYAYGAVPIVFDWGVEDLAVKVQAPGAEKPRTRNLPGHVHYVDAFDLWPGDVQLDLDPAGRLRNLVAAPNRTYNAGRTHVAVWDRRWGRWIGYGSRRRAYADWYEGLMVTLWRGRYLERSVDPARVGYAPAGVVTINGQEFPATDLMRRALMALKNGSAFTLPAQWDPESNQRMWEATTLELPDRSGVWDAALTRSDARKLIACLVPPSTVGVEDATFAGARIPAQMFVEFVQSIASWTAVQLTEIVRKVHRVNYGTDAPGARRKPPEVRAYELPAAKRKLLLEVFRSVVNVERAVGEGKVVTLGEMIDDEILAQLNLPTRPVAEAAREKQAPPQVAPPGRPGPDRDTTSEREERREAAREPEGEDATGEDDEAIEE